VNLTAPDGEPTKATYIFTTMLLKLIKQRKPDFLVVAMDSKEKTFRHDMYEPYKANRPPMPDELPPQIERIEQILSAMNIPIFRVDGYEADDVIGTLVQESASQYDVFICSKDKDLEQLIAEKVSMYDPKTDTVTDIAALKENKGITPEQVIDVLTLVGDTSDNVPGVPDVGPKTALQWIQKYGSLDNLLANRDEIKGKRGDNLRASLEQLELSRRLVTIHREVPLPLNWDEMAVKPFNRTELEKIFKQLYFSRLLVQLDEIAPPSESEQSLFSQPEAVVVKPEKSDYHLVDTDEKFETFFQQIAKQKKFALDTETTGLNPVQADLVGMSFSWEAGSAYYLPLRVPLGQKYLEAGKTLDRLRGILEDPQIKKTGQNIKYDMVILRCAGLELAGVDFDTMVASYIVEPARTQHNLDVLALDLLGHETIKLEALIGKGKNQLTFDMVDTEQACDYAAEDADITWRLRQVLEPRFTDDSLRRLFEQVEMPLVEVLAEMEYNGTALDIQWLKKLNTQIVKRMEELVEEIYKEAGCTFNIDSPKQLSEVLFSKIGLEPVKKTKSGQSTDQEVLEILSWQHPVPSLVLEYRKLSKLKNTYVDKLPAMICSKTKRVHASFNQAVTSTGRLSSSNPNLQNIPIRSELGQEIRRAFVPGQPDHVLLAADYSQIELRMLAHYSGDAGLRKAFAENQDIHQFVAAQVNGITPEEVDKSQRSKAKAVNFGIVYGQTAYGLSRGIGIPVQEAQKFIDDYFNRYPRIREFIDGVIEQAKKDGFVRTILGRKRMMPDINSRNQNSRRLAERMAVNTVIQGSAADLIKVAMVNIFRRTKAETLELKMILQVHDELVFELPDKQAPVYSEIVREEMVQAMKLDVPVVVDISWGKNWLECK
jgi:DNA polymerase-1